MNQRPLLIRLFNSLPITTQLEATSLIKIAQQKTGLHDFGPDPFQEGLERLLQSINQEASLHRFGKFISKQRLVNVLCNRLRVQELIRKNPEIEAIEIKQPIIITGLQRTGTTRLHRLLSAHPQVRSLSSWEALNPAPLPNDKQNVKRKNFAKTAEKALKYMSPEFFAIHPVEHESPEEDILINDMTFISTVPEATMFVPTYAQWVENQSHEAAYRYLKKILQVLTWQQPKARWVLKTPQHLEFLAEANMVFPDAKFIHTYRDPLKVLPSFFSMVYQSRKIFSDQVDAHEAAQHWLNKNSYMMQKAQAYWDKQTRSNTMHISYYDMMKHTNDQMEKIYAFCDLPINEEVWKSLEHINTTNKQNKYGVHSYQLENYGMTKEQIDQAFEIYRIRFNIPYE